MPPNLPEHPVSPGLNNPGRILYFFVDGIGLGLKNPETNPFARFRTAFLGELGGYSSHHPGTLFETDAHMGVPGLPQSATGQTALFTGFNGAQIMGRHVNGYIAHTLRPYFQQSSLIQRFVDSGYHATLLNAYSDMFLQRFRDPRYARLMSGSSWLQLAAGLPFFTLDDLRDGNALYMDITHWFLRRRGENFPMISPKEAGRRAVRLMRKNHLSVFEYFFTDKAGHEKSFAVASRIIRHVDGFIEGIFEEIDPSTETFVMSSDHGNLEDLSHYTHTENLVPTLVYGQHADLLQNRVHFLYDIPRVLYDIFGIPFDPAFKPEIV